MLARDPEREQEPHADQHHVDEREAADGQGEDFCTDEHHTRLQQIATQVQSELKAEETALQTEAKTLEGQRASLDQKTFETRANALQTKAGAFQRKAALRERELQATQQKALGRVGQELDPILRQIYQQNKCGLLLNRDAVVIANMVAKNIGTGLGAEGFNLAVDSECVNRLGLDFTRFARVCLQTDAWLRELRAQASPKPKTMTLRG